MNIGTGLRLGLELELELGLVFLVQPSFGLNPILLLPCHL